MINITELNVKLGPGKRGKHQITLRAGEEPISSDVIDIHRAGERARYVKNICADFPGISEDDLSKKLLGMAASDGRDGRDDVSRAQADVLVKLAENATLFHNGVAGYATVEVQDHQEHYKLRSEPFQEWLTRQYYRAHKKAPTAQALKEATGTLTAMAKFDGQQRSVHVRIARHDDALYLDLANGKGQAVKVTRDGWTVEENPPVKFIRTKGMLSLPIPEQHGQIDELRSLINAGDDTNWHLIVAWMMGALRGAGPYAILGINGEQGSAKSTTSRMIRQLIDPNQADLRSTPKEERDLMIAGQNSHVLAFDNLSTITLSLSDSLCRVATGAGFATRELYTDDGEKLFNVVCPILFNGISEVAVRPDLLERSIIVSLPPISSGKRVTEADLWKRFELARPRILGALLDAVVMALRNVETIEVRDLPRMADFAKWVCAAEPALGWAPGTFLNAYNANRRAISSFAIDESPVGRAIEAFIQQQRQWTGTVGQLHRQLDPPAEERYRWPNSPRSFREHLSRVQPVLRSRGVTIEFGPHRNTGREIHLQYIENGVAEQPDASSGTNTIQPADTVPSLYSFVVDEQLHPAGV